MPNFEIMVPDYEKMPRTRRNKELKKMLQNQNIIVFPDDHIEPVDGLPGFSIMFNDLKDLIGKDEDKAPRKQKLIMKQPVDMGQPSVMEDEVGEEKHNSQIDPSMFKGNVDLQTHIHRGIHKMIRINIEKSTSLQVRKEKKRIAQEDFNLRLPEEEIKHIEADMDSKKE